MAVPALGEGGRNLELVEHAADDVIDHVVDRLRMVVEGRHRRQHHHAHARELEHVFEMHLRQRRLAHQQHQLPALLEDDIGGAVHEVLAVAIGDAGERAHRAGDDHHALGEEGARRDRRTHVALAVDDARERSHLLDGVVGLMLDGALRPLADDEMGFDIGLLQRFEEADANNGPGRSGHADDQAPLRFACFHWMHDQFLNRWPNFSSAMRRCPGDGAFTAGNLSRQCHGRQASMTARLLV